MNILEKAIFAELKKINTGRLIICKHNGVVVDIFSEIHKKPDEITVENAELLLTEATKFAKIPIELQSKEAN